MFRIYIRFQSCLASLVQSFSRMILRHNASWWQQSWRYCSTMKLYIRILCRLINPIDKGGVGTLVFAGGIIVRHPLIS